MPARIIQGPASGWPCARRSWNADAVHLTCCTGRSPVSGKPIEILLVEDNPADVRLTQEALREGKVRNNLHVARDGVEALEFLRREGKFAGSPRPDLVLLDLNLPRKDGREVLAQVKDDAELKTIPIVVLTTSSAEIDILRSYS